MISEILGFDKSLWFSNPEVLTFGVGMDLEEMVPFLSPEGTEQWRQLGKTQSSHILEQYHLSVKWTKVAVTSCQSSKYIVSPKG